MTATRITLATLALLTAAPAMADPIQLGTDFVLNHSNAMPAEQLNLAIVYDGAGDAMLGFQYSCAGTLGWEIIGNLTGDITRIYTYAYDLNGCRLTGRFGVRDVTPNGVVDGVAFGLFWKDASGDTHTLRSAARQPGQNVLGVWPLGQFSSQVHIDSFAVDITRGFEQLRTIVPGSALLDNGLYHYPIF